MRRFADLYDAIDRHDVHQCEGGGAGRAISATRPPADAAWALFFLTGRRLKRHVPTRLLHAWTLELTGLPEWLVEESYSIAGDFAETIALLLDGRVAAVRSGIRVRGLRDPACEGVCRSTEPEPIDTRVEGVTLARMDRGAHPAARGLDDEERRLRVLTWWTRLERRELFLLNKLLTGEFRVGVSHTLVVRAVAQLASLPTAVVEHRLMGNWEPSAAAFAALVAPGGAGRRSVASVSVLPRVAARGRHRARSAAGTSGWWNGSGTASARS